MTLPGGFFTLSYCRDGCATLGRAADRKTGGPRYQLRGLCLFVLQITRFWYNGVQAGAASFHEDLPHLPQYLFR